MVPLPRFSTVAGIPLTELVTMGDLTRRRSSTRSAPARPSGGAEITKLVGTSAWYAPGAAAAQMVEAILKDKKQILPCSVFLQGEYGVTDQFLGVPVKLGKGGAEKVIEITLTDDERAAADEVGRGGQGVDCRHRRLGSSRRRGDSSVTRRRKSGGDLWELSARPPAAAVRQSRFCSRSVRALHSSTCVGAIVLLEIAGCVLLVVGIWGSAVSLRRDAR